MSAIVIIDDHEILLDGLKTILGTHLEFEICTYSSPRRFREDLQKGVVNPELVISDIQMPEETGIDLITDLHYDHPTINVMVMSMLTGDDLLAALLEIGIKGYFVKGGDSSEFVDAVRKVLAGESYFSTEVKPSVDKFLSGTHESLLSSREREIALQISKGFTTNDIAENLHLSKYTIQTHRKNIFKKLGVHSTAELLHELMVKNLI